MWKILLVLLLAAPVHALSCAYVSPEEQAAGASVAFIGTLLDATRDGQSYLLEFAVNRHLKGDIGDTETIIYEQWPTTTAPPAGEYFVLAFDIPPTVGMCNGLRSVEDAENYFPNIESPRETPVDEPGEGSPEDQPLDDVPSGRNVAFLVSLTLIGAIVGVGVFYMIKIARQ